ncbi:MAG: HPr family phosphocarrier protein [Planctomycetes bacterium]|nr:HPr family phosphocarrier protein [Planctomycetota bacterium]
MAYERQTQVRNKEGLHFRPIMRVVDAATKFASAISVLTDDRQAEARSPMELLMLVATHGTKLTVRADGTDEREAVDALVELIESGFGETL